MGLNKNYILPLWLTFVTAKMPATHHRDFIHQLRELLVFIEFNNLICILLERQHSTSTASAPACPQEKKESTQPLGHRLDTSETRKGMLQQPPARPHTHRHPRIPEFCQDAICLFDLITERIHHRIKKSVPSFRKPLEVGFKLAIILRHLATGETYTSLQYYWLVGCTTICKFVAQVC